MAQQQVAAVAATLMKEIDDLAPRLLMQVDIIAAPSETALNTSAQLLEQALKIVET